MRRSDETKARTETQRQRFARTAVARLNRLHGGEYVVIDFGDGPIQIIQNDGQDLPEAEAKTLAAFRWGFRLFGGDV